MSIRSVLKRGLRYIVSGVPNIIVRPQIFYSNSSGKLKGKKILLTGGSRGLGYAMAKKFVEEGAQVIITGRKLDTLKEASEQIGCKFIVFDVTDTNKYEDLIRKAEEELGGLNVLVNNAGISLHEPSFFDVTLESFDRQINTNLKSDVFLSQCFIKRMIEEKREVEELFAQQEYENKRAAAQREYDTCRHTVGKELLERWQAATSKQHYCQMLEEWLNSRAYLGWIGYSGNTAPVIIRSYYNETCPVK